MRIRCHNAAAMALITNRQFCDLAWVQEIARKGARGLLEKDGDASGLLDLAPADAQALLAPEIPRLIKTQKPTGLWRTKNARNITYALLKALAYSGLQETVIPQLRHDPYRQFRDADDWYGIAVRCRLLQAPRADEQAVKDSLFEEMAGRQCADGSWEHTVIATVHHLEMLLETGLVDSSCFSNGVAYLFSRVQPDVVQRRSGQCLAHHMISSDDRAADFRSAQAYKPQWLPASACYNHLPVIQTGYTLRLLNITGFATDPRVIRACRNLVDLHARFGGWCASPIHHGLLAEKKKK